MHKISFRGVFRPRATAASAAVAALLAAGVALGQDDMMGFIPDGGRTLLAGLIEGGARDAAVAEMTGSSRDAQGWLDWIADNPEGVPGLGDFDEYQARTLANYLAVVAPIEAAGDDATGALPPDGRDMALQHCQSCHIITVVITQDRTRDAWLGTLNNPSHVEIALDETERGLLADYLVVNGGIPIEMVPEALRAGGASY